MIIPVVGTSTVATPDLHETNSPLDHSAGEQATLSEVGGRRLIETVKFPCRFGFPRKIEQSRGRELQPRGEFVAFDARLQPGVASAVSGVCGIQFTQER